MAKDVYELGMHEGTTIHNPGYGRGIECFRVPGGWIYTFISKDGISSTFVPFKQKPPKGHELETEWN